MIYPHEQNNHISEAVIRVETIENENIEEDPVDFFRYVCVVALHKLTKLKEV